MALYVRELSKKEGNQLKHNARKGADPVKVRRSLVVLASAQKMKVPEISDLYHLSCEHIRKIIHHFNEEGMASLAPHYGGGRSRTFTDEQRADIVNWPKSHRIFWDILLRTAPFQNLSRLQNKKRL